MGECPCWSDEHHDRGDGVMVCGRCGVAKCPSCEGEGCTYAVYGQLDTYEDCARCGGTGLASSSASPRNQPKEDR